MSAVTWLTIGVRNPRDNGSSHSACIWANELRVTDFNDTRGWAANASLNAKLADFANVTANIRHSTFGFGGVQSRIGERTREDATSYDVSANVAVDKLFPESFGLRIPMYVSYQKDLIKPFFDPANPDISLEASLLSFPTESERSEYRQIVTDETTTRSLNFSNVRKEKTREDAKNHFYDVENLSFSYAFSERTRSNFNLQRYRRVSHEASVAYNYAPQNKPWTPFANWESLNSPFLQLIKDFNFNPIPTNIAIRLDLRRRFEETVYRNEIDIPNNDVARFEKYFTMDRVYNINWSLTENLRLDYSARANAIIDEPEGRINNDEKRDSIWTNLKHFGRMKNFDQRISMNYQLPLDKLPLTDWLNAEYRYEASYNWRAGPFYSNQAQRDSLDFGNTIQNGRDNTLTGKIDMVTLYNKVGFLREINNPSQQARRSSLSNTTESDSTQQKQSENKGLKALGRFIMMLRSVNATYTLREGTILPGYTPRAFLFGMDSTFSSPGLPFILGSQSTSILRDLADEGDLTNNPNLTQPFIQNQLQDYKIQANLEPLKNLSIRLDVGKAKLSNYQELFHASENDPDTYVSESPNRTGTYAISFMTIKTAFEGTDDKNNSEAFNNFEDYRLEILERFRQRTGVEYDTNSQDVLIPAFIAAYSGKDPGSVGLSPFPKMPVPNWSVDYTGLASMKGFSDLFSSISITHGYQSNYKVNNYTTSLEYDGNIGLDSKLEDYNESYFGINDEGEPVPLYTINQVVISEQFAPLLGINLRTKSRVEANVKYSTKRDLVLNINNSQITEVKNYSIQIGGGFTKANMTLPFRSKGRTIVLKNDLRFRLDLTITDTRTIQRKIDELNTVTNGTWNFQLRPNISYVLSDRLSVQAYFERTINEPKISSTPRRSTTRAGFQVRFSLDQ